MSTIFGKIAAMVELAYTLPPNERLAFMMTLHPDARTIVRDGLHMLWAEDNKKKVAQMLKEGAVYCFDGNVYMNETMLHQACAEFDREGVPYIAPRRVENLEDEKDFFANNASVW